MTTPTQPSHQRPRWPWFIGGLVVLGLIAAGIGIATRSAGPTPAASSTTAPATSTSRAPVATTAPDPLAAFSTEERAFIRAFAAAGYSLSGGNQAAARFGELICTEIDSGRRPAQTQADIMTPSIDAADAKTIYELAHSTMCASTPLPDPNSFSDGTYEVGVDIQPGKYKSPGGDSCYWARLAKDQEDILDNDLTDGPTTFTVKPTDGFVELSRCTWTLQP